MINEILVKRVYIEDDLVFDFDEGIPMEEACEMLGVDMNNCGHEYAFFVNSVENNMTEFERENRLWRARLSYTKKMKTSIMKTSIMKTMDDLESDRSESALMQILDSISERSRGKVEAILSITEERGCKRLSLA